MSRAVEDRIINWGVFRRKAGRVLRFVVIASPCVGMAGFGISEARRYWDTTNGRAWFCVALAVVYLAIGFIVPILNHRASRSGVVQLLFTSFAALFGLIFYPVILRPGEYNHVISRTSYAKQLSLAYLMYLVDSDQVPPPFDSWEDKLQPYHKNGDIKGSAARGWLTLNAFQSTMTREQSKK